MSSRYDGKFLRLLELYVLWVIGQLPGEEARRLEGMTPKLADVYGQMGSGMRSLPVKWNSPLR